MDPIAIIVGTIMAVYALFAAFSATAEIKAPEPGNPNLPTVSQSRKIPLAVGRTLVTGPNILDAGKHRAHERSDMYTMYSQNIEMAIAYGPGVLYSIWMKDKSAWDGGVAPLSANGESVYLNDRYLFGGKKTPGEGGISGAFYFCPGNNAGYIFPNWEASTGRSQPGYPLLSRVLFYSGSSKFYWGNSPNYAPVSFEYGFFPNPLGGSYSVIGPTGDEAANPAYVLYEILKNSAYGTSSPAAVDNAAILAMGATLSAEGLGIRRTWYTESAAEIEREILDLVDGVRYRDPLTGNVVYKLLRDDYAGIPTVTDDEIIELAIAANSVSSVPNKVSVTYMDAAAHYKEKKVTQTNTASRLAAGHDIQKEFKFLGAKTSAIASKLLTREVRKESRPRRSGKVVLNRTAWDWSRGDTFIINSNLEGIVSLPVRVLEHKKHDIEDGKVVVEFIEEVFVSGGSVFDIPTTGIDEQLLSSAAITTYQEIVIPRHFYSSPLVGYESPTFGILADDPISESLGLRIDVAGAEGAVVPFPDKYTIAAAMTYSDASITIAGRLIETQVAGSSPASLFANILILNKVGEGCEFLSYTAAVYNSGSGTTALTGCKRGLYGSMPLVPAVGDAIYEIEHLPLASAITDWGFSSVAYNLVDVADLDETLVAASPNADGKSSYAAPLPPAYFGISGNPYPVDQSGGFSIQFRLRGYEASISSGSILEWTSAANETILATESVTLEVWDTDSSTLLFRYSDYYTAGESEAFSLNGMSANIEVRGYTKDSNTGLQSVANALCKFYYSDVQTSNLFSPGRGINIFHSTDKNTLEGMNTATSGSTHNTVNTFPLAGGKYYFECRADVIGTSYYPVIGVIDSSLTAGVTASSALAAVQSATSATHGGSGTVGGFIGYDTICVAVDTSTRKVWIRKNGDAWAGGGDPAADTTPYKTLTGTGSIYPFVDLGDGAKILSRFSSGHAYTLPTGFSVWG